MPNIKKILLLTVIYITTVVHGFGLSLQTGQIIQLAKGSYTLEDLLQKLEKIPTLKVSYNTASLPMEAVILVEKDSPTLLELIAYVGKTGKVEVVVNDIYLVFRSVKNEKKFKLSGIVTDTENGEPLPGVNIYNKGTGHGVVTNVHGEYFMVVAAGEHNFVFSFIGFSPHEKSLFLDSDKILNVQMILQKTVLAEIQITAQRKFFGNMDYGRDISTISSKEIGKLSTSNASDILHARIAGVWATKTSGAPGDHQKIRIRGQNSLFTSAEPLYVIDGVPVPIVNLSSLGIADLNINDIENVSVLKDASSTALYGFQGGNGVVLIDTKKGSKERLSLSYKTGVQWFSNFYDLVSSKEQLEMFNEAQKRKIVFVRNFYPSYTDSLCSNNRQEEIFSPAMSQEYQLSGGGTIGKTNYFLSGNFTNQSGVMNNAEYKRYNFSGRIGRSLGKRIVVNLAYRGSRQMNNNNQDEYLGNRLLFDGISTSPCLECTPDTLLYNYSIANRTPNKRIFYNYDRFYIGANPKSIIADNTHSLGITTHAVNGQARFQITRDLSMDFMESYMLHHSDYFLSSPYKVKSNEDVILINHQFNISYNKEIGNQKVGALLAFRKYKDNLWWEVDSMSSSLPDHYLLKNSMAAYGKKGSVLRDLTSYIGHVSYNFSNIIFLSAVANISRVEEGVYVDYYHLFPSLAFSIDFAKLKLFNKVSWLDQLNLYANAGESGNYPLSGLSNDLFEDFVNTSGQVTGLYPAIDQLANHHLKHESTSEWDIGLKSSFLKQRFAFSAVYFEKNIRNLIIQRDIPQYYGGGKTYLNIGGIAVHGIELGIDATLVETKHFTWYNQFNISGSTQVITKLHDNNDLTFSSNDLLMPSFTIREGEPIGNIYGYKILGRWNEADDQSESRSYIEKGGMKFFNADSTNKGINETDKVVIGNSIPNYTWNLNNVFQFRDFSIDIIWYAAIGAKKFNATRAATIMTGVNREANTYIYDSLTIIKERIFYESSEFIEDASFIKLKTLSITYNLPKKLFGLVKCNVALSAENLLTFTRYKGYDPEATIFTDNNFSDNAVDRGAYPNPKAVYGTIQLKF
jgi:TonB-dependent starch-binding outer membrane protein SusC